MDITEISIVHHIGIVIALLWILFSFGFCNPVVYFVSFVYLCLVNERYTQKLRRRLLFEERKQANQRRLLSDSETVRWLNHAVEKVWPICMEQIASQKILFPIIPWFLDKYKPWTARKAIVQHLYLGRNPLIFTEVRVRGQSAGDDHLVMELGMNFLSADDMSAILAVKLRKRLGGIWAKMHVTRMHVEGKVLVGVKFLRNWPFLGRLRICFVEPPYFQMTVKPIFNHGVDVTELPGISGWLEKLLAIAFEQTLVEPNMLVVDMQKFASAPTEGWFTMDEKSENIAIAFAMVEIVEAADLKPADLNGLADPYVKGKLGRYGFQTKTQKRTLAPKWQEEFKIPICTWESPNMLLLEVDDKDHFRDDNLGYCSVNISDLRGTQRHDMWLPLQNVKTGRVHLAVTVHEVDKEEEVHLSDGELSNKKEHTSSMAKDSSPQDSVPTVSSEKVPKLADQFEPIDIEGQEQTGIWVHHPGDRVSHTWEPRKGKTRLPEIQIHRENNDSINSTGSVASGHQHSDSSSDSEDPEGNRVRPPGTIRKGLRKIGSIFNRSPKDATLQNTEEIAPTPSPNDGSVDEKDSHVKFLKVDDNNGVKDHKANKESISPRGNEPESPGKGNMKGMAKSILKQAGRSARGVKHALRMKGTKKTKGDPKTDAELDDFEPSALLVPGTDIVSTEKADWENSQGPYSSDELKGYSPKTVGKSIETDPPNAEGNIHVGPLGSARDVDKPLVRKVYLEGMDHSDDVADHVDVHSQMCSFDSERDARKHLQRKVSFQGADRTDDIVDTPRDMQGQVVPSDSRRAIGGQLIRKASFQGAGDDMTAPKDAHCQVESSDSTIGTTEPLLGNISLKGVDRSDDNLAASEDMQGRVLALNSAKDNGDLPIRITSLPPMDRADDDAAGHAGVHGHVGPSDLTRDIREYEEVIISR